MRRYIDSLAEKVDYSDSNEFDRLDALFGVYQGSPRYHPASLERDRGSLAWGAALIARSYLCMYRHTKDERYLRKFIGSAEQILLSRDSELGLKDYKGKSGPVWSSGKPYTSSSTRISLDKEKCILEIRAKIDGKVQIDEHENPHSFNLRVYNNLNEEMHDFLDLNLDRDSDRFITKVLSEFQWKQPLVTARVIGSPSKNTRPPNGTYALAENYYVAAVETGQICVALLEFCELVSNDQKLKKYESFTDRYLVASKLALDFHVDDFVYSDGNIFIRIAKGAPHDFEGTDAPLNHLASIARCYTIIYSVTREMEYREVASMMLSTVKQSLQLISTPSGLGYSWPYFDKFGKNFLGYSEGENVSEFRPFRRGNIRPEDISHAILTVEAVVEASKNKILFDDSDIVRFTRAFVHLVRDESTIETRFANYIDGTGGYDKYLSAIARWSFLSNWSPTVWQICRDAFNVIQPSPEHATVILGMAQLSTSHPDK